MIKLLDHPKTKYYLLTIILLGVVVKLFLFDYQYIDYGFYLSSWIENIKTNGYFSALKDPFYNYTPMYMYVLVLIAKVDLYPLYAIKLVSIGFEYLLAFFLGQLAFLHVKRKNVIWLAMAIVPLVPTVLLNSSFMSQCDALYTSFAVGSVYFSLTNKPWKAMLFLGIAFSLKVQTAIILPFYFVYMLRGNIKWYMFLLIPVIYFLSVLPVWMVGRPLMNLLTIYLGQASYNTELVKNFPNFYVWVAEWGSVAKGIGLAIILALTLVGGWLLSKKKYHLTLENWYQLLLVSAVVCPFFLPGMLERYMYLGDVFAILLVLITPKMKNVLLAFGIIFISFYSYIRTIYTFSFSQEALYPSSPFSIFEFLPWEIVSVAYVLIIGWLFYDLYISISKSKLI